MSHLCLMTEMTDKQRSYISKIQGAANTLLSIINDILDFSKIESGKFALENVPFSFSDMIKNLWDLIAFKAEEKGLALNLRISDQVPEALEGDPLRLGQILINLCNNALKFTERGSITLAVDIDNSPFVNEDGGKSIYLRFMVEDTGIGMTPEQQRKLFKPFTQADGSITRKYGGSGLGLSISKYLAEAMSGAIWIESEFGTGSRFYFRVRLDIGKDIAQSAMMKNIGGMRFLVVDDDDYAREVLERQLSSLGVRVDAIPSGAEGILRIGEALQEGHPYDFLFIDWKMPDLDGEMTVRELYEKFPRESLPHVVMISAYSESECREISEKIGLDGFLSKPMGQSDLHDLIMDILARTRAHDVQEKARWGGADGSLGVKDSCVLVVEDNEINQEIAEELLTQLGIRVSLVGNGMEAIEAVKRQPFDLVFMDVQMPIMDGLLATRQIRTLKTCGEQELPIIAMTAHAMKGDYEKSIEAGMNDHITKPIDPQILAQTVVKWMPPLQQRRSYKNIMPPREAAEAPPPEGEDAKVRLAGPSLFSHPIPGIFVEEGLG
jgi:CheY-like chemotaxis protein